MAPRQRSVFIRCDERIDVVDHIATPSINLPTVAGVQSYEIELDSAILCPAVRLYHDAGQGGQYGPCGQHHDGVCFDVHVDFLLESMQFGTGIVVAHYSRLSGLTDGAVLLQTLALPIERVVGRWWTGVRAVVLQFVGAQLVEQADNIFSGGFLF